MRGIFFILLLSCVSCSAKITDIVKKFRLATNAEIIEQGSELFDQARVVENGLCRDLRPAVIVMPKSENDVSQIVRIAAKYNRELSVRSGGHSFLCQGIKNNSIHIDMRHMNQMSLIPRGPLDKQDPEGPSLILGPGLRWGQVLEKYPREKYTYLHGQCHSVGVGGFLLGGGYNGGTSQRYGRGSEHVLNYRMVDAEGNIVSVNKDNATVIDPDNGSIIRVVDNYDGVDLFTSLQHAGASYGITTQFQYRIYEEPEVHPTHIPIYLTSWEDMEAFEKMAFENEKFHMMINIIPYFTTERFQSSILRLSHWMGVSFLEWMATIRGESQGFFLLSATDNFPAWGQTETNVDEVYDVMREYNIRPVLPQSVYRHSEGQLRMDVVDYESAAPFIRFPTENSYDPDKGFKPVITANSMNFTSLTSIKNFVMNHPIFGINNLKHPQISIDEVGCEFCYVLYIPIVEKLMKIVHPKIRGVGKALAMELTCIYTPNIGSRCPETVRHAKHLIETEAIKNHQHLVQYLNTPSCGGKSFKKRYFADLYPDMLRTKKFWDPSNVFHYCQSVGSDDEDCCPQDI